MTELNRVLGAGKRFYAYGELVTYHARSTGLTDYEVETPLLRSLVAASASPADLARKMKQRGISAVLHNTNGGITQSAVAEMTPLSRRELGVLQDFFRLNARPAFVIAEKGTDTCLYLLGRTPSARGGLRRSKAWLHLPTAEGILSPADRAWDAGQKEEALDLLREAVRRYPGYAYTYQRIADIAGELGRKAEADRAAARFRALVR